MFSSFHVRVSVTCELLFSLLEDIIQPEPSQTPLKTESFAIASLTSAELSPRCAETELIQKQITHLLDEEGYLTDFSQWNEQVAEGLAGELGITLTDKHWDVIKYLQEQYKNEVALSIRGFKKSGVVTIKELYALFPNGPLKISTKIAGIPKPASCI